MPPQPTDRRVRRTRKLLQDGLLKLLCTKPLDDITVKEIVESCQVNRQTFLARETSRYHPAEQRSLQCNG